MVNNLYIIYACHINSENHIDLINWQLYILKKYIDHIKIVFSSDIDDKLFYSKINLDRNQITKVKNEGYDTIKYQIGLLNINKIKYDYIIFMNDSFFFWREVEDIFSFIKNQSEYDFIGLLNNNSIKEHYQSWFLCLSNKIMNEILKLRPNSSGKSSIKIIEDCEINFTNYLINKYKSHVLYNYGRNIFTENDYFDKIKNDYFPVIKNKFLLSRSYPYIKFPDDFNPNIYKNIYSDLNTLTDQEANNHFINCGMKEQRLYKENQKVFVEDKFLDYIPKNLYKNFNI